MSPVATKQCQRAAAAGRTAVRADMSFISGRGNPGAMSSRSTNCACGTAPPRPLFRRKYDDRAGHGDGADRPVGVWQIDPPALHQSHERSCRRAAHYCSISAARPTISTIASADVIRLAQTHGDGVSETQIRTQCRSSRTWCYPLRVDGVRDKALPPGKPASALSEGLSAVERGQGSSRSNTHSACRADKQQRLCIARAIAADPEVRLMDEAVPRHLTPSLRQGRGTDRRAGRALHNRLLSRTTCTQAAPSFRHYRVHVFGPSD